MFARLFGTTTSTASDSEGNNTSGTRLMTLKQLVSRREEKQQSKEGEEDKPEKDEETKELVKSEPRQIAMDDMVALTRPLTEEERATLSLDDNLRLGTILSNASMVMTLIITAGTAYLFAVV